MGKGAVLLLVLLLAAAVALSAAPIHAALGVTVNLSVDSGPIGTSIIISGTVGSPNAGVSVYWDLVKEWDGERGKIAEGFAVDGSYRVIVEVPPAGRGPHLIIVRDEVSGEVGCAVFTVLPEVTVNPKAVPPGGRAVVSGRLIGGKNVSAYLGDVLLGPCLTDPGTGYFELEFIIPDLPPGSYNVSVYWCGTEQASVEFTVLQPTKITVVPSSSFPGDPVRVLGVNFAPNSRITVYFGSIAVAETSADDTGSFMVKFYVPQVGPGTYNVTAIDDVYNAPASAPFKVQMIKTRGTAYYPGDVISLYVESVAPLQPGTNITVTIYDARGIPFSIVRIPVDQLVKIEGKYYAPYWLCIVSPALPSDAETGAWSWRAEYYPLGSTEPEVIAGEFAVLARGQVAPPMLPTPTPPVASPEEIASALQPLIADIVRRESNKISAIVNEVAANVSEAASRAEMRFDELSVAVYGVKAKVDRFEDTVNNISNSTAEALRRGEAILARMSVLEWQITENLRETILGMSMAVYIAVAAAVASAVLSGIVFMRGRRPAE